MNYYCIIVALGGIALDFASGIIKGAVTEGIKSFRIREGLMHKIGSVLYIALGVYIEYAQKVIDLGIPFVPACGAVCAIITLMEIFSILENVCTINPEISPKPLKRLLGMNKKEEE